MTHAHRVNFWPPHQCFSSPYVLFYSPLVSKLICLPLLFLDSSCLSVATVTSLHHSHHRVTPQTHADQRMKIPHSCDEIEQIHGRSRSYKSCDGKRALSKAWQNEEEGWIKEENLLYLFVPRKADNRDGWLHKLSSEWMPISLAPEKRRWRFSGWKDWSY